MKKAMSCFLSGITVFIYIFTLSFFLVRNQTSGGVVMDFPEYPGVYLPAQGPDENAEDSRIDLNTATVLELMSLPGIGETYAQRIIDYRKENGPFTSVTDLLQVDGIGSKRLESILDYIKVGGQHEDTGR